MSETPSSPKAVSPSRQTPSALKKGGASATPRGGAGATAGSKGPSRASVISPDGTSKGGAGNAAAPSPAPKEEVKEPSDDEYLRQLYEEQKEAERIRALESTHDTLLQTVAELHNKLATTESKHSHMALYRQRETAKQVEHIKSLDVRIAELQKQNEDLVAAHSAAVAATATQHSAQISALEDRMAIIQAKYESLYQFKEEKSDLELQLAKYKELLGAEKEHHALNVSELERRNVMEKDRLKNEMLRKIRETKLSLLAMTEDQLHTTTKRTIMENEQMTTELQYQSKETERIVKKNSKLASENANLKRELELATSTQTMMAKKTMFYQNLIAKLQNKVELLQGDKDKLTNDLRQTIQQHTAQSAYHHAKHGAGGATTTSFPPVGSLGFDRSGAGGAAGASALSGILRGVEEMNALAHPSGSTLPQLNRSLSSRKQSQRDQQHSSQGFHTDGRNSTAGGAISNNASYSQSDMDSAAIARLSDKLASVERERNSALEQLRSLSSALREEKLAREAATERVGELENEVAELQAQLKRLQTHKETSTILRERAIDFIANCVEDQRMELARRKEADLQSRMEVAQQTFHSVVEAGNESTVVVRGEGEKPIQGTAALLEQTRFVQAATDALEANQLVGTMVPSSPAVVTTVTELSNAPPIPATVPIADGTGASWNLQKGYPQSLTKFTSGDRAQILEHLLQQIASFQRSNPKEMGLEAGGGLQQFSPVSSSGSPTPNGSGTALSILAAALGGTPNNDNTPAYASNSNTVSATSSPRIPLRSMTPSSNATSADLPTFSLPPRPAANNAAAAAAPPPGNAQAAVAVGRSATSSQRASPATSMLMSSGGNQSPHGPTPPQLPQPVSATQSGRSSAASIRSQVQHEQE